MKKSGIKLPPDFETLVVADMYWTKKGTKDNRKSFVYYAPTPAVGERPKSDSLGLDPNVEKAKRESRARASFAASALASVDDSGDEGDASRYKVKKNAKTRQSEVIHDQLEGLVQELDKITNKKA